MSSQMGKSPAPGVLDAPRPCPPPLPVPWECCAPQPSRLPLPIAKLTGVTALDPLALLSPAQIKGHLLKSTGTPRSGSVLAVRHARWPRVWVHDARAGLKVAVATFVLRTAPQGRGPAGQRRGLRDPGTHRAGGLSCGGRGPRAQGWGL